ncbi:hypothetical protein R1sor_008316 [Riccia sorocarpa]|uniref:F-box domain-containing protein n=1 Tax=Riccia sorocarpa TaxID=122646 RepID=A0ABD3HT00_9MARC
MDPEVWKHLADHEDILRLILCRVSWDINLRLRSVSKAFYSMLSEPSGSTWSSRLTDTSFRTDHQGVMWVNGEIDAEYLEQSNADTVCLLSTLIGVEKEDTFEGVTYAVLNFEIHRWCKLPTLGDLPFGNLNDFTVTGVGEGLLLLERLTHDDCWIHDEGGRFYFGEPESKMSEGGHGDDSLEDIYELDRFVFNPLTKGFIKLPVVPKIKGSSGLVRMTMAVENEVVTVVAVEFYEELQSRLPRILIWRQVSPVIRSSLRRRFLLFPRIYFHHRTRLKYRGTLLPIQLQTTKTWCLTDNRFSYLHKTPITSPRKQKPVMHQVEGKIKTSYQFKASMPRLETHRS